MLAYFERANDFIHSALTENEENRVLVHCAAGASRSGAFCCAYMIVEGNMTLDQALAHGRKNRKKFFPNFGFQKQLRCLEQALANSKAAKGISMNDPDEEEKD